MSFFDVAKTILSIGIDVGTGVIVGHYASAAVGAAKGIQKVCAGVAAAAVGGYIGSKASEWACEQVDIIEQSINSGKPDFKEMIKDE